MARLTKYNPATILMEFGPLLSGQLSEIMMKNHNTSKLATKKGIERAFKNKNINRIDYLTFGKGEYLYYSNTANLNLIQKKILNLTKTRRPKIYRLWMALKKEKCLTHRECLKITGLPTRNVNKKESYNDVREQLIKLEIAYDEKIKIGYRYIKFFVYKTKPLMKKNDLKKIAQQIIENENIVHRYIDYKKRINQIKNINFHAQKGSKLFDVVGEAVSRRHMIVVYDFTLRRTLNDYDIDGLLDRIYSVYRKKFPQVIITTCIFKNITKSAKSQAMTGRFKQIILEKLPADNNMLKIKKITGTTKKNVGEYFENTVRYILDIEGFKDVQRGLILYKKNNGISENKTSEIFTDIDIITQDKKRQKIIICELKNWHQEIPEYIIENWITDKLNIIITYLKDNIKTLKEIEAWYIVSNKPRKLNSKYLQSICKCNIEIFSKTEFVNKIIRNKDLDSASELNHIMKYF